VAYPARPVRLVVGAPAGGGFDIVARLMGQWLSDRLGQQFVVENRPGAGSNIATEAVVRAPPDGYTLLLATASNAINATLYDNLNFNFLRDIVPVAYVGGVSKDGTTIYIDRRAYPSLKKLGLVPGLVRHEATWVLARRTVSGSRSALDGCLGQNRILPK
jgi:tripartite-type tricarboxylate transporter receptor subunit TctC